MRNNCNNQHEFIVVETGHIELRHINGELIRSVCCKGCIKQLKLAIKKLEKQIQEGRIR